MKLEQMVFVQHYQELIFNALMILNAQIHSILLYHAPVIAIVQAVGVQMPECVSQRQIHRPVRLTQTVKKPAQVLRVVAMIENVPQ